LIEQREEKTGSESGFERIRKMMREKKKKKKKKRRSA